MVISSIVAVSKGGCIGKGNKIPWYLPADLKYFKRQTTGRHIIMGRKCFESIGKPLPNRTNIVITRQQAYKAKGCVVVNSLEAALALARFNDEREVFIIGGGEIYRQSMPLWQKLYVTEVDVEVEGCEIHFPSVNYDDWDLLFEQQHLANDKNKFDFVFKQYIHKKMEF